MSGDITVSVSLQMTMTIEKEQDLVQTQKKRFTLTAVQYGNHPLKERRTEGRKGRKEMVENERTTK